MQFHNEPLKGYIKRFIVTYIDVKDSNECFAIQAFKASMARKHVHYTLFNMEITCMHELVTKAQALAEVEEIRNNHTSRVQTQEHKRPKPNYSTRPFGKDKPFSQPKPHKHFVHQKLQTYTP